MDYFLKQINKTYFKFLLLLSKIFIFSGYLPLLIKTKQYRIYTVYFSSFFLLLLHCLIFIFFQIHSSSFMAFFGFVSVRIICKYRCCYFFSSFCCKFFYKLTRGRLLKKKYLFIFSYSLKPYIIPSLNC